MTHASHSAQRSVATGWASGSARDGGGRRREGGQCVVGFGDHLFLSHLKRSFRGFLFLDSFFSPLSSSLQCQPVFRFSFLVAFSTLVSRREFLLCIRVCHCLSVSPAVCACFCGRMFGGRGWGRRRTLPHSGETWIAQSPSHFIHSLALSFLSADLERLHSMFSVFFFFALFSSSLPSFASTCFLFCRGETHARKWRAGD